MGTMITLGIGRMEIDWGKNNIFTDHSALFKPSDVKDIPYNYVDIDTGEPVVEMKEGYARKLSSVRKRLDLLGYDLHTVQSKYEEQVRQYRDFGYDIKLSFKVFYDTLSSLDITQIDAVKFETENGCYGYDLGEYARKFILTAPQIKNQIMVEYEDDEDSSYIDPQFHLAEFLENLDSYITLRILAENRCNAEQEVCWYYADVVEEGWVQKSEIVQELPPEKRILIVTEGSSDSYILKEAIKQLYPDISDFFDFVDMKENCGKHQRTRYYHTYYTPAERRWSL